jgi:hypothetical protein
MDFMTTYANWQEPARVLALRTGPAAAEQLRAAAALELSLRGDEPYGVLDAMLRSRRLSQRPGHRLRFATDAQRVALRRDAAQLADDPGLTRDVASAWLQHYRAVRNLRQLEALQLQAGDPVLRERDDLDRLEFVSSIRHDGYVNLKGGNGNYAWAYSLERASVA